jgi:hypothetical protein
MKALTVGRLREALAGYPAEARVLIEGCDCYGWASAVRDAGPSRHTCEHAGVTRGEPCVAIDRGAGAPQPDKDGRV